jgi:hypothetical protein
LLQRLQGQGIDVVTKADTAREFRPKLEINCPFALTAAAAKMQKKVFFPPVVVLPKKGQ